MKKLSIAMGLAAVMAGGAAPEAFAHGSGGDIAVFATGGKADVGYALLDDDDIHQIAFDPNDSVFQAVLVPLVGAPPFIPYDFASTEPGYDANEGALPALAEIRWNLHEVGYWDDDDARFWPINSMWGGYAPQPVLTNANGGFHSHQHFGLYDLDDNDGIYLRDGVYLAKFTLSVTGLLDSDPYYVVSLVDSNVNGAADPIALAEEIGDAVNAFMADPTTGAPVIGGKDYSFYASAIQYAETLPVPEPTGLALVAMLAACVPARRRG